MKTRVNLNKIAKALGAERRGHVKATGGYFGASELVAEVQRRFRSPAGGGRITDQNWTERRLVGFSPTTLQRLKEIAEEISHAENIHLNPMQVAALLLERTVQDRESGNDILKQAKRTGVSTIKKPSVTASR
jgi:hypothetical protein